MAVVQRKLCMRPLIRHSHVSVKLKNLARCLHRLKREHMLVLYNVRKSCLYLSVNLFIKKEDILAVELCPQLAQLLKPCLSDVYLVGAAGVAVIDA